MIKVWKISLYQQFVIQCCSQVIPMFITVTTMSLLYLLEFILKFILVHHNIYYACIIKKHIIKINTCLFRKLFLWSHHLNLRY